MAKSWEHCQIRDKVFCTDTKLYQDKEIQLVSPTETKNYQVTTNIITMFSNDYQER